MGTPVSWVLVYRSRVPGGQAVLARVQPTDSGPVPNKGRNRLCFGLLLNLSSKTSSASVAIG